MDDLKLIGKSDAQMDSLVQTVFTFSEDIGMEFGLKKCEVVILKKGKLVKFDGIYLPNQEVMKEVYLPWIYLPWDSRLGRDKRTRN